MTRPPARLLFGILVALALRAASGQAPPTGGSDPYATAPAVAAPAPVDPQRYPIVVGQQPFRFGGAPQPQPQPAPAIQPPAGGDQRYPLPGAQPAPANATKTPDAPGAASPAPVAPKNPSADSPPDAAAGELFQPAQIVATVGDRFIFYGDVSPTVEQILAPAFAKIKSEAERQVVEGYREALTRQTVRQMVEAKLMYLEFEREIAKDAPADKMPEIRKNINKKVAESFEQDLQKTRAKIAQSTLEQVQELTRRDPIVPRLALLMRDNNAETLAELDAILRRYGSTLEKEVRYYGEYMLGRSAVRKYVNFNPEVTHQEMLDYYHQHAAEYAVAAKVRFEILTAKYASFPTPAEAEAAIAAMGNEVFFGTPFAAVAKKSSQEPNAKSGGYYDWTTQGSLASEVVDQALFTIEVGKLSQILKDDRGCHIIRVLERQPAGQVSFVEAQKAIKEAIVAKKRDADSKKFVEVLSKGTQVRTIWEADAATAQQPQPGTTQR